MANTKSYPKNSNFRYLLHQKGWFHEVTTLQMNERLFLLLPKIGTIHEMHIFLEQNPNIQILQT